MIIDSHQHFWHYDPVRDGWITEPMQVIRRDFLPEDLLPVYRENGIDGCVAVQADQSEEETHFLLDLAESHDFIKGVVGWIDLKAENVEERLEYFSQYNKLKGFRHIVQAEPEGFMLQEEFLRGIGKLDKYGFTYDIVIYPNQLDDTIALVKRFPDQKFVLDHIAKPYIKDGYIDAWELLIREIAGYSNVYCKISGMLTEADWKNWKYDQLVPYLDVVVESFGVQRLMFGSDWPVCLLAGTYKEVTGMLRSYFSTFTEEEKRYIWEKTARNFYGISVNAV